MKNLFACMALLCVCTLPSFVRAEDALTNGHVLTDKELSGRPYWMQTESLLSTKKNYVASGKSELQEKIFGEKSASRDSPFLKDVRNRSFRFGYFRDSATGYTTPAFPQEFTSAEVRNLLIRPKWYLDKNWTITARGSGKQIILGKDIDAYFN